MEYWAARAVSSRARELSKAAFGQELRLGLCLYVARLEGDYFTLSGAASALGVSSSALQAPLASLLAMGVVRRLESGRQSRERWLGRNASATWRLAEELFEPENDEDQLAFDLG